MDKKIQNCKFQLVDTLVYVKKHLTVKECNSFHVIGDKQLSTVFKTTVEGIHKTLPDFDFIRSVNSHQMIWMESLLLGFKR